MLIKLSEQFIGFLIQIVPCAAICYFMMGSRFTLPKKVLFFQLSAIIIIGDILFTFSTWLLYVNDIPNSYMYLNSIFVIFVFLYALYFNKICTISLWIKLFIFVFSFNYGLFTGLLKNIFGSIYRQYSSVGREWMYSPFLLLVITLGEILTIPLCYMLIRKFRWMVLSKPDLKIWKFLCIVNIIFCGAYYMFSLRLGTTTIHDPLILSAVIVIFFAQTMLLYLSFYILEEMLRKEQLKALNQNTKGHLKLQSLQYNALLDSIEASKIMRHDTKHHINTLLQFLAVKDIDSALTYINEINDSVSENVPVTYCANPFINATVNYYLSLANKRGINVTHKIDLSTDSPFPNEDLCILIGNILENALDAATLVPQDQSPFIYVKGKWIESQFIFSVQNSFDNTVEELDGIYISTKHDDPGIGITSIKKIVTKYNGSIHISHHDHIFQATAVLLSPALV